jgi:hypothetical protein
MHDSKVWNKTIRRRRIRLHRREKIMGNCWLCSFLSFLSVVFIAINVSVHAGDPAYKGLRYCIVKYPKTKLCSLIHRPLPPGAKCNCPKGRLPAEREYNWIFDGVRSRVEKIIGQVVHHKVRLNLSYFCVVPFSHTLVVGFQQHQKSDLLQHYRRIGPPDLPFNGTVDTDVPSISRL